MSECAEVWIVQSGVYDHQWIEGAYSSVEKAIAAHPVTEEMLTKRQHHTRLGTYGGGGWKEEEDGRWNNGLAGDDFHAITRYVVDEDPDAEDAIGART